MKRLLVAFALLGVSAVFVYARTIAWRGSEAPRLALPDAYACAAVALGSATNDYHCVRAMCLTSMSPDGEWWLSFFSTNGTQRTAIVFFDKTTKIIDGYPSTF
jgi:hypothetical protein